MTQAFNPNLDWSPAEVLIQTAIFPKLGKPNSAPQRAYLNFYDIDFASQYAVSHTTTQITVNHQQIHLHWVEQPSEYQSARGSVIFLHGLYDHVGLFKQAYKHWLDRGYNLLLADLPGHGLSTGKQASIQDFNQYDDVLAALLTLRNNLSNGPWLGAGQSTGCAIWINHMARHQLKQPPVDALLLFAPLVRPSAYSWIKCLYRCLKPFKKRVKRTFKANTANQAFSHFIQHEDPLQARWIATDWVGAMLQWVATMDHLDKQERYQSLNDRMVVLQGTYDFTVDWPYNLKWLHRVFPNADIVKIDQAGHHCLNEIPETDAKLWAAVDHWLEKMEPHPEAFVATHS
jgi:alpha-beta hydrolase superfamily lysophospholipase